MRTKEEIKIRLNFLELQKDECVRDSLYHSGMVNNEQAMYFIRKASNLAFQIDELN